MSIVTTTTCYGPEVYDVDAALFQETAETTKISEPIQAARHRTRRQFIQAVHLSKSYRRCRTRRGLATASVGINSAVTVSLITEPEPSKLRQKMTK